MVNLKKAVIFSFNGKDQEKAHLLEHCLGAYFLNHRLPLHKMRVHSLGVCALFDDEVPKFPTVSDLEPYIENQKKRMNVELLTTLDARDLPIERMHQLHSETFDDAITKIESILEWDNQEILKDFERIYKTKVEATDLTATLPKVSTNTGFKPTKHKMWVPKLDPRLDVAEVTIRVPNNLDAFSWWVSLYSRAEREVERLGILSDLAHGFFYSVNTLPEGYHYFSHSPKTRAGQGQRAIDSLLDILKNTKLGSRSSFNSEREIMIARTRKNWKKNKLTDFLVTELLLRRHILKPEDFESLSYKKRVGLHQEFLSNPDNFYILTDF